MPLSEIKALVCDMDGVLWKGDVPLAGLVEFFAFLRSRPIPFVLATNNAGRHPQDYVAKLAKLGVPDIETSQIVTSSTATADYLRTIYPQGTRLYVIGNAGLPQVLEEAGFVIAEDGVAAVVAGIDSDFSYAKAKKATLLIRNDGAAFIGTNPDLTYPSPEGLIPGAGSIIGMIELTTDVQPILIGKPARAMFDVAIQRLGTTPQETLMLGDKLNTDISGGANAGLQTAFVLTGVSKREEIGELQPDYIFDDLPALIEAWEKSFT
jgi:4-nitrophenyl phosphatase